MAVPQRLPIVGQDDGTWGDIIRQFLMKEHYNDDTDNPDNGGHQNVTIRPGTTSAAPLTFSSGSLLTTPAAGSVEFNSSDLYFTPSTTRKKVAIYDDSSGATGDTYYRDGSGNFVRLGIGSSGQTLQVASGQPAWGNSMNFGCSTQTSSYTLTQTDTVVLADASSSNITNTLPAASSFGGHRFYIKRIDDDTLSINTVTIGRTSSDTIDGATSYALGKQYDVVEVVSNGSNWFILSSVTHP
jgi:hypothetical protein